MVLKPVFSLLHSTVSLQLSLYFLHCHLALFLDSLILHYLTYDLSFSHLFELSDQSCIDYRFWHRRYHSQVSIQNLIKIFPLSLIVIFTPEILNNFSIIKRIQSLFPHFFKERWLRCNLWGNSEGSGNPRRLLKVVVEAGAAVRKLCRRINASPKPLTEMRHWRSPVFPGLVVAFGHAFSVGEKLVFFLLVEISLKKGPKLLLIKPFYIFCRFRVHLYGQLTLAFTLFLQLGELILDYSFAVQRIIFRFPVWPLPETADGSLIPCCLAARQWPEGSCHLVTVHPQGGAELRSNGGSSTGSGRVRDVFVVYL